MAADGAIAGRVDRDSFGRVLDATGTVRVPIGFAGGIEDPDTGLVRFGLRDYDPQTGRFTSRDPSFYIGSPDNLFAYASNAPTDHTDPTGLWSVGASGYFIVGGGVNFSFGDGTFGICAEVGGGLGAGAELDVAAEPSEGTSIVAEIAGTAPNGVGAGVSVERATCPPDGKGAGPVKVTGKVIAGAANFSVDNQTGLSGITVGGGPELKVQGKIAQKECWKWETSWW
jgi:RHS repeat-associated protein